MFNFKYKGKKMKKNKFLSTKIIRLFSLFGILVSPLSFATDVDPRIVGGYSINSSDWPSTVALMWGDEQGCGGSLVAPTWILTAAHCIGSGGPNAVVLGRTKLSNTAEGQRIEIDSSIIHPGYDALTADNDIALIHLTQPSKLKPAFLVTPPSMAIIDPMELMTVVGWGHLTEGGFASDILQEVDVEFISRNVCNSSGWYGDNPDDYVTTNQFCAGFDQGGKDSCQGDSGGPIFIAGPSDVIVQTGIVSWGEGCAREKRPGVYTRVANYIGWIKQNVPEFNVPDKDNDGVPDHTDNCSELVNPYQWDSNNDGFGNLCDADLNNDNWISFSDLKQFKLVYGTNNADADLDGNGIVGFGDFAILKSMFGKRPGPAGN